MAKSSSVKSGRRAVVVGGLRTPFCKAFSDLTKLDTIALGAQVVSALIKKLELYPTEIDSITWGGVILPPLSVNVGREIVLDLKLPYSIEGHTVTRACASGLQAITSAAAAIERGDADVIIAGGSDSTSNAPIAFPSKLVNVLGPMVLSGKATPADYLGVLPQLMPLSEILPKVPKIAERTTGEVMGESAERMAKRNEIARGASDEFALRSHQRAARAIASGRFDNEVTRVETPDGFVHTDNLVRADTSLEKLGKLRAAFAKDGTVTAGNASPLTDGAAATILMSAEKAKALGYTPLCSVRSWSYVAVDPSDQLLIGPALCMPKALDRAGMKLADIDFVDIHEAFAAQVLSVLKMLASKAFANERLGKDEAVGEIDIDRLNVHGGSIAIGHPFGATGARMVTTMANELAATGKESALLGICAAGGLGAAAVLEQI
jgi:acetyl-CoA acyltransferase